MSSYKILWSANDPGGAHAVIPVVEALMARGDEVVGIVTGPAYALAQEKNLSLASEVPWHPDLLLAGTSMGDSPDKKLLCELTDVPSVYVMDFWSNYRARFASTLPTRLCVIDRQSKEEAAVEGIPADRVVVTGNPYFERFAEDVTRDHEDVKLILFISQPVRADIGNKYGFDEYHVLGNIIAALPKGYRLGIRLHPRDDVHKYERLVDGNVFIMGGSLEEALSRAGLIVGMFSPVLMQAATAGKLTMSYQPGGHVDVKRMGLGLEATSPEELKTALSRYAAGEYHPRQTAPQWPTGAVNRIIAVIDELL